MKQWVITVNHLNYDTNQIKSIDINEIDEDDIPIEFSDVQATDYVFENGDLQKKIKTLVYYRNGSKMFKTMDSIWEEMISPTTDATDEFIFEKQSLTDFQILRIKLRNEYPEYII